MDGGGVEVVDEAERRWERRRRPEPSLRGVEADDREDSRAGGMESPGKRIVGEDMLAKVSCENLTIY
jgi:hypothetical protein